jgi:hypothetical protein
MAQALEVSASMETANRVLRELDLMFMNDLERW